jgi:hypothetical protein
MEKLTTIRYDTNDIPVFGNSLTEKGTLLIIYKSANRKNYRNLYDIKELVINISEENYMDKIIQILNENFSKGWARQSCEGAIGVPLSNNTENLINIKSQDSSIIDTFVIYNEWKLGNNPSYFQIIDNE